MVHLLLYPTLKLPAPQWGRLKRHRCCSGPVRAAHGLPWWWPRCRPECPLWWPRASAVSTVNPAQSANIAVKATALGTKPLVIGAVIFVPMLLTTLQTEQ